jgi:hypothetical protein
MHRGRLQNARRIIARLVEAFSRELQQQFTTPPEELLRKAEQRLATDNPKRRD